MATIRFGTHRVKVVQSTTRQDRANALAIKYGDISDYTVGTDKIVIGGMPLSLAYHTQGLLVNAVYKRVYALRVIEKASTIPVDPSNPEEISGIWDFARFGYAQNSDGKLYLQVSKAAGDATIENELILHGMPLATTSEEELVVVDSGLSVDDVQEYSSALIGGIPATVGRVGNYWFLIVAPI